MNRDLVKPVTASEIHKAVMAIKGDSAPDIDGMTGIFFQKFWTVTGAQVVAEVKNFFDTGSFPQDWNHTQIFLLPKKPNPNMMTDLRPISLCSVTYKIVSKILCTRLKRVLPRLVSPAQGAFVAGRLISDNLLIAHEMIHGLRTNPSKPTCPKLTIMWSGLFLRNYFKKWGLSNDGSAGSCFAYALFRTRF